MIYAEILAGGVGSRMSGASVPKQYLKLDSEAIILKTIKQFIRVELVDYILVLVSPEWKEYVKTLIENSLSAVNMKRIILVEAGANRNETIAKGLEYLVNNFPISDDDVILTHDAVRPFLSSEIIEQNIYGAQKYGAVDTVVPATDTIVHMDIVNNQIESIPIRREMFNGQTPQSFNLKQLIKNYSKLTTIQKEQATDAISAVLMVSPDTVIKYVVGDQVNMKITTR